MIVDVDTLDCNSPNGVLWSRANFEEAMPGVLTPLSWSFWGACTEASSRRIYVDKMGVFAPGELTDRLEDTTACLFHGRAAVNVDLLRRAMLRIPGADPDALERQVLGRVREDAPGRHTWRRVPHVVARVPANVALAPRRLRALRRDVDIWWRRSTATDPGDLHTAGALVLEALARFTDACTEHGFNVFVGQAGYDALAKLAVAAGHSGLELRLAASGRGIEETVMIEDLRAAAAGRLPVDEVVARHGYHGPDEGQISSRSWREDRGPLLDLLGRYRAAGAPPPATGVVAADRAAALGVLLSSLPRARRDAARVTLRFVDTYLPLREVGKAAFLQCIDVGRHAAHVAGRLLAVAGRLDEPEDVQFLSVAELANGAASVDRDVVAERKARRAALLAVDLPDAWVGVPEPWPVADAPTSDGGGVRGVGASPGVAKGAARVITDARDCTRLEPGDVLVCELTDPGWAPLLAMCAAAVIDIGGPLSHGAIVARELGVPCVIGTNDGTRRIVDGAMIEVDGDRGEVRWL